MEIADIRRAVLTTIKSIAPDSDVQRIEPDRPLRRQIELDSMDWLNVITALREALSVDIPESDYGRLATLDSIVAYAASRQREQGRGPPPAPRMAQLPSTMHRVNGIPIVVRPMLADDLPLEADFVRHLSKEARYKRFMVTLSELSQAKLEYLTDVDQVKHVALVATTERDGRQALAGVARYIVDPAGTGCEFAIEVDDAWQGSGVAGILMGALLDIARARGLVTMEGIVLQTNARMLKFARQLGFTRRRDPEDPNTVRVVRSL